MLANRLLVVLILALIAVLWLSGATPVLRIMP